MPDAAGDPSDEALMSRYARGDPAAFDRLFARYEPRAYAFFLARVRSPERASDLFQELFLRVHRGRATFRPDGRFAPWFFGVARRVLVDEFRRRSPVLEGLGGDLAASGPDPERAFEVRESLAALEAELSAEEQTILVAAKGAGADLATIARRLGRTTAAVRQIVSRATRRLRANRGSVTEDDDGA
jgi:RNA polymerase sigma-70 factor (ECF subfamily)